MPWVWAPEVGEIRAFRRLGRSWGVRSWDSTEWQRTRKLGSPPPTASRRPFRLFRCVPGLPVLPLRGVRREADFRSLHCASLGATWTSGALVGRGRRQHGLPEAQVLSPRRFFDFRGVGKETFWDSGSVPSVGKRIFWDSGSVPRGGKEFFWDSRSFPSVGTTIFCDFLSVRPLQRTLSGSFFNSLSRSRGGPWAHPAWFIVVNTGMVW